MTTLALVLIASCGVVALVMIVRRTTRRPAAKVDMSGITVSRQWLMQHQSDRL